MSNKASCNPLELSKIRSIAAQIGTVEETYLNTKSRVVSFHNYTVDCRINVYYTTGTVGTCLYHPVCGKTQLFRRGVTYELLADIFRHPRVHTGTGYFRKDAAMQTNPMSFYGDDKEESDDEETALKKQLMQLEPQVQLIQARLAEIAALKREEQQKAAAELAAEQKLREEQEEAHRLEAARQAAVEEKARKNRLRGEKICASIIDMDDTFPRGSSDIACVAITSTGWALAYDSGQVVWDGVPDDELPGEVERILRQQHQMMIAYIAIGPQGQYYIRKTNGKQFFSGPEEFVEAVHSNASAVKFVSFGDWDTFYVHFENGTRDFDGLPWNLSSRIGTGSIAVDALWVGEREYDDMEETPYFVSYGHGKCSYKNLPHCVQSWLSRMGTKNIHVKQLLAEGDSFFVRYS